MLELLESLEESEIFNNDNLFSFINLVFERVFIECIFIKVFIINIIKFYF